MGLASKVRELPHELAEQDTSAPLLRGRLAGAGNAQGRHDFLEIRERRIEIIQLGRDILDAVVTGFVGHAVGHPVDLQAARLEWRRKLMLTCRALTSR